MCAAPDDTRSRTRPPGSDGKSSAQLGLADQSRVCTVACSGTSPTPTFRRRDLIRGRYRRSCITRSNVRNYSRFGRPVVATQAVVSLHRDIHGCRWPNVVSRFTEAGRPETLKECRTSRPLRVVLTLVFGGRRSFIKSKKSFNKIYRPTCSRFVSFRTNCIEFTFYVIRVGRSLGCVENFARTSVRTTHSRLSSMYIFGCE